MNPLFGLSRALHRKTNGKSFASAAVLLALTLVLLKILNTPFGVKRIKVVSDGVRILDMQPGYTPDQAYATLDALGEAGRQAYVHFLAFGDILLPLAYGFFLATALGLALRGVIGDRDSGFLRLNLLPLAPVLLDLAENAVILGILAAYPERADGLAAFANTLTIAKSGALKVCFGSAGILFLAWGALSVRRRLKS